MLHAIANLQALKKVKWPWNRNCGQLNSKYKQGGWLAHFKQVCFCLVHYTACFGCQTSISFTLKWKYVSVGCRILMAVVISNESCLCLLGFCLGFCWFFFKFKLKTDTFSSNLYPSISSWIKTKQWKLKQRSYMQAQWETYFSYCKISELLLQWELVPYNSFSSVRFQLQHFWADNLITLNQIYCILKKNSQNKSRLPQRRPRKPKGDTQYCCGTVFMVSKRTITEPNGKHSNPYQVCTNQNFL